MPKWCSSNVLDSGLNYIKSNCNTMAAVINYTAGDAYSTVMAAANIVAQVSMASADFTLSSSSNNRLLTSASGKQAASASNTGDPSHIVFVNNSTSEVIAVTTESTAQTVTAGNPVLFPSIVFTANQPT